MYILGDLRNTAVCSFEREAEYYAACALFRLRIFYGQKSFVGRELGLSLKVQLPCTWIWILTGAEAIYYMYHLKTSCHYERTKHIHHQIH